MNYVFNNSDGWISFFNYYFALALMYEKAKKTIMNLKDTGHIVCRDKMMSQVLGAYA